MKHTTNSGVAFRLTALVCALVLLFTLGVTTSGVTETLAAAETALLYMFTTDDSDASIPTNATRIVMEGDNVTINGAGATVSGDTILIAQAGTYVLSGSTTSHRVLIDANKKDIVRLALDNASIEYTLGAAINAQKVGRLILIATDGSVNSISGGLISSDDDSTTDTTESDETDDADKSHKAAVYSKNDLVVTGNGTINVNSAARGLWAKDYLVMTGGMLNIKASTTGIRGSDGVAMKNVTAAIVSGGDGIKSTKEDDTAKGYIQLEDCSLTISAGNDGIQAISTLLIFSGTYNIKTGEGSGVAPLSTNYMGDRGNGGNKNNSWFGAPAAATTAPAATDSMKGLKSDVDIRLLGGEFMIDTQDDAIHSNGEITIYGGSYDIATGDDGVHADKMLTVEDGMINISRCYEGLESVMMYINGGDITIAASDDGLNVAGGTTSQRGAGRGGYGLTGSAMTLTINGGVIRATGSDAVDADGNIIMNGGELYLSGPSMEQEAAVDVDGSFTMNGGSLVTAGYVSGISSASAQPVLHVQYSQSIDKGSVIELKDAQSGNTILSYVSNIACSVSGFSSPELKPGQNVSVYVNGVKRFDVAINTNAALTTASESGGAFASTNGRGGFGGFSDFGGFDTTTVPADPNGQQRPGKQQRGTIPGQP
ncbi:hypothetical protein FACS1894184_15160 [Clostridia bacterium]|nr:hypothetical protein FACS1894184_15160 [Clostridia bacterium]